MNATEAFNQTNTNIIARRLSREEVDARIGDAVTNLQFNIQLQPVEVDPAVIESLTADGYIVTVTPTDTTVISWALEE